MFFPTDYVVPEKTDLCVFFERALLHKFDDIEAIVKTVTLETAKQDESTAFDYLQDLLHNYKPNAILDVNNILFSVNTGNTNYLNNRFELDKTLNDTPEKRKTLEFLTKAIFVASYMQTNFSGSAVHLNDYFPNIDKKKKATIGYSDLASDNQNINNFFWRIPFMVSYVTVKEYEK